jgi:hypothetical protein
LSKETKQQKKKEELRIQNGSFGRNGAAEAFAIVAQQTGPAITAVNAAALRFTGVVARR